MSTGGSDLNLWRRQEREQGQEEIRMQVEEDDKTEG